MADQEENEVPPESEAQIEDEAPPGGEVPPEGETPPEGEAPPEGETPPEGEAPPEDETPPDEAVPESDAPPESDVAPESEPEQQIDTGLDSELPLLETEGTTEPVTETSEEELAAESPRRSVDRTSTVGSIPVTDSDVLTQLREADEHAIRTAMLIQEIRQSITRFDEKEELTEEDVRNLDMKKKTLMEKLDEFEEITINLKRLVGLADASILSLAADKATYVKPVQLGVITEGRGTDVPGQELGDISVYLSPEDKLPKVVVCGTQDQVPRIIVCEGLKRKRPHSPGIQDRQNQCRDCAKSTALIQRLNECYSMQDKLVSDNKDLEGDRYALQEELLFKDKAVECLQKKLECFQADMKIIWKENTMLKERLEQLKTPVPSSKCKCPCGKEENVHVESGNGYQAGLEPGDAGPHIQQSHKLECQLSQMENEVKMMVSEMEQVQRERQQLVQQRKMLEHAVLRSKVGAGADAPQGTACQSQIQEFWKQYNHLVENYNIKVAEVASLRSENNKLREGIEIAQESRLVAEARVNSIENTIKNIIR